MTCSLDEPGSWVVERLEDGKPLFETFDPKVAKAINTGKYRAVPILEYLGNLNRKIKQGAYK